MCTILLFKRASGGSDTIEAATRRNNSEHHIFERLLRWYNLVIPLGAVLLYWFRLRHLPILNQFMAYMILCVLLPYVSGDYTLVYVYLIWGAFLLFLLARCRYRAGPDSGQSNSD